MDDSILNSVKKALGLTPDYTAFDQDILMHINSVFGTLNDLGIGPEVGFEVQDATAMWVDFLDADLRLNPVKSYVYLRVRMLFDPPTTSYLIGAMEKQIDQLEWRLTTQKEAREWVAPIPPAMEEY